jgi:hypothetical protein
MTRLLSSAGAVWALSSLLWSAGCGGRPAELDVGFDPGHRENQDPADPSGTLQVRGLTGSVALLDPALHEVMMFTSPAVRELRTTRLPVGRDVAEFKTSTKRDKLFVLSRGVTPRYKSTDEPPQLRVFDGGSSPKELENFELQDPYNQLEIDPEGEWLLVHGSEGLVSNPNELLLVHLGTGGAAATLTRATLGSYGGKPLRFTFTSELSIPGAAPRRLLVVQREKDLAILDLSRPEDVEITVALPENATPLDVVYHDGIPDEVSSLLGVQLQGDSNVDLLTINEAESTGHAFSVHPNLIDVGGIPSKLDFVQTRKDGGLRLAALVPSKQAARLVDPSSGVAQEVPLHAAFTKIRRITNDISEKSGEDIALLYGEATNTIAFWRLGITTGTPYHSIEAYDIGINVGQVFDIPSDQDATFADHKILSGTSTGSTQQFYVLDLTQQKSFPLDVLKNLTLNMSPSGQQLWAFGNDRGFAQLTFDPLQPASLYTQEPIAFVHDFATERGDGRSALALHILPNHGHSSVAATLFDGRSPSTAQTKFYSELELEGIK